MVSHILSTALAKIQMEVLEYFTSIVIFSAICLFCELYQRQSRL